MKKQTEKKSQLTAKKLLDDDEKGDAANDTEDQTYTQSQKILEPPSFYEDDIKKFKGKFDKSITEYEQSQRKSIKNRILIADHDHNTNVQPRSTGSSFKKA